MRNKMEEKKIGSYILATYLGFWLVLVLLGCLMKAGINETVFTILQQLSAWTPNVVVLVLFHKLLPEEHSRKEYCKRLLSGKRVLATIIILVLVQTAVFVLSVFLISRLEGKTIDQYLTISVRSFFLAAIGTITSGAVGEELFNFLVCFYRGDFLRLLEVLAIFYFAGALILAFTSRRFLRSNRIGMSECELFEAKRKEV